MRTSHIGARLDEHSCEVSFFRAWTSYAHPVKPIAPLSLEQALRRSAYQRAWRCRDRDAPRLMLLETVENETEPIELEGGALATSATTAAGTVSAFEARTAAGKPALGRGLKPEELLAASRFIAALPLEGQLTRTLLVSQKVIASFRYRYRPDGALASVTIVNPEGRISVLES